MKITMASNRFIVECGFSENHLAKAIPSVRFDARRRAWVAQKVNRNCKYLIDHLGGFLTPDVRVVCEEMLSRTKVVYKPLPGWYKSKLPPYAKQQQALDFSYGLRNVAFFMGMGSGKTKVSIDLHSVRFMENEIEAWIVFCPINVKPVWVKKELPKHLTLDIPVFHLAEGNAKAALKQVEQIKKCDRFILVVGIESLSYAERYGSAYEAVRDVVINRKYAATIDESHLCKGHDSIRSKNVFHLVQPALYRSILTGTATSQGFIDLFQQFEILDPNILGFGSYFAFRARYAMMGGYENKEIVGYQNIDELVDLIRPFTFQCTKEEVVDLPPKVMEPVYIQLTPEQRKMYDKMNDEMKIMVPRNEAEVAVAVEQALTKYSVLQQIIGGFINVDDEETPIRYFGKDGVEKTRIKREAVVLIPPLKNPKIKPLIELANNNPRTQIIVWAKYRTELRMLKEALEATFGLGCCSEYHGGISKGDGSREREEERFLNGHSRFMLSNQQTGGTGTTWIVAELTYYYSNSFRMIDREQSEDRNHRIGTKNTVIYVDAIAEGTIDEDIVESTARKVDMANYLKVKLSSTVDTSIKSCYNNRIEE